MQLMMCFAGATLTSCALVIESSGIRDVVGASWLHTAIASANTTGTHYCTLFFAFLRVSFAFLRVSFTFLRVSFAFVVAGLLLAAFCALCRWISLNAMCATLHHTMLIVSIHMVGVVDWVTMLPMRVIYVAGWIIILHLHGSILSNCVGSHGCDEL